VYAVYDERHALQYIGYSRNMVLAIKVRSSELTGAAKRRSGQQACSVLQAAGRLHSARGAAAAARVQHIVYSTRTRCWMAAGIVRSWIMFGVALSAPAEQAGATLHYDMLRYSALLALAPMLLPVCLRPPALQGHLARVGEERCAFVRPMVFANRAMAGRTHMEAQVTGASSSSS
jgi:hypothetical protein